jgi:dTDP-4-amino-4,6-dideoxygalactose transaminase
MVGCKIMANVPINVTKSFLPPISEYEKYLKIIWDTKHLTNNGPLLKKFEKKVKDYLEVDSFQFVSNGTIALQISLEALGIRGGDIITTPFSYVATTSSILWQRCKPVYVDIDQNTLNIDVTKIEAAITKQTKAIMAVHVFGNPCDVEAIEKIALKHDIKVIYDAAHAFGVKYKDNSLFNYGDISTASFHATKLFHTIEGGGIVAKADTVNSKLDLIKRFGHHGDEHHMLGINAKANEFQAAMGLANLPYLEANIEERKQLAAYYDEVLGDIVDKPKVHKEVRQNFIYYPAIFSSEEKVLDAISRLNRLDIYPRRYFYPSLNTLPYLTSTQVCPVSEDISKRILCLPLYNGLDTSVIKEISEVLHA